MTKYRSNLFEPSTNPKKINWKYPQNTLHWLTSQMVNDSTRWVPKYTGAVIKVNLTFKA